MLTDYWYPACASSLLRTRPVGRRVLDRDLVLFRDPSGAPAALEDRCCHRGVRLSLGTVRGGRIACGYHGWQFDAAGRCVHVPSLAGGRRIPAGCEVPSLPCVERDGYVWVWPARTAPVGEPAPIPDFDRHRWRQGAVEHACDWVTALENNLDWCHPPFAHPWTHGAYWLMLLHGLQEQHVAIAPTSTGLVVRGPVGPGGRPVAGRIGAELEFLLPCRAEVRSLGGPSRRIVLHVVPTGTDRCRLEWMMPASWPFGRKTRWVERETAIFRQDRVLMESAVPGAERSVEADAPTLLLRRIVARATAGETPVALAQPRVIRVTA